ncbi:MAG: hypothetical protein JXB39_01935 [Deltaproteobacteria bacterium]|nr:hypothetical protein [Deltaproteobacteria bacterium]
MEDTCRRILDLIQPAPSPEMEDVLVAFARTMADRGLVIAGFAVEAGGCAVSFADDAHRYCVRLSEMPSLLARLDAGLPICLDLLVVPEGVR